MRVFFGSLLIGSGLCFVSVSATATAAATTHIAPEVRETLPVKQTFKPKDADRSLVSGAYVLVLLVLAAGAGWVWVRRRHEQAAHAGVETSLQIIKRQRLSPKATLHVVRYGDYEWLVAEHAQGVSVLDKVAVSVHDKPAEKEGKK